ncbi:MAG: thioesterase family protein [Ketobacteraceae bacterium]|nr:thioesterase family protein [Ketobacteraceae bacterium]
MLYRDLLESVEYHQHTASLTLTDDWLQGRSMFGGLQAALALLAMRTLVPGEFPLRTLQFTFMAPIPPGKVCAGATELRAGKNTRHAQAVISDGRETQAMAIAVFGKARQSQIKRPIAAPKLPSEPARPFVFEEGVTPAFTRHFSASWLQGDLPFSGSDHNNALVRVAMKEAGTTSEGHLLAIADFIPPVALAKLRAPAPGSSLTWMIEILDTGFQHHPLDNWLVDAEMTAAADGYTSQSATIFAPDGSAVALSRQSMVVFG